MSVIRTGVVVASLAVVACGQPTRRCVPGDIQSCTTVSGCLGTQTCNVTGSAFGLCECPAGSTGGGTASTGGGVASTGGGAASTGGGQTAGGSAGGLGGGAVAGGAGGGSVACSSATCAGCCTARGTCIDAPANATDATCGTAGQTCADCRVLSQTCSNFTCVAGSGGGAAGGTTSVGGGSSSVGGGSASVGGGSASVGGGSASVGGGSSSVGGGSSSVGGGSAGVGGGSSSVGGGSACGGCRLSSGACIDLGQQGNSLCGSGGQTCVSCPSQTACSNGACVPTGVGGGSAGGAGGGTGGGTPCGPGNCLGCCLADGRCLGTPLNGNDITCGRNGAACQNCTVLATTCNQTSFTCNGSVGGGSAGGGGAGGGSPSLVVGDPCSTTGQCQTTLGPDGRCKQQNLNASVLYSSGYCTVVNCGSTGVDDCPLGSLCVTLPPILGEETNFCVQSCTNSTCRPSYTCFTLGTAAAGCLPTQLSSPTLPFDTVSTLTQGCTSSAQCRSPGGLTGAPFAAGACLLEVAQQADGGQVVNADGGLAFTGFLGGQCTRFCDSSRDCSSTGQVNFAEGVCLVATATTNLCFQGCANPLVGQSNCRAGYVCESLTLSDGGLLGTGYCEPRCDNLGWSCGTRADGGVRACLSTGFCER